MKISYLILTLLVINTFSSKAQTADFNFTTSNNLFCSPQVVTFTASTAGNPSVYIWEFGDGQSGNNTVESHLYNLPGTYNVTLTSVYSKHASAITKTVVINMTPTVSLNTNRSSFCQPGNIPLTATGTGTINSYQWDFGDGTALQTTATNTIIHNYTSYGNFNVTVKAITANGCSATDVLAIQIAKIPVTGSVDLIKGCIPINTTLTVSPLFLPGDGLQNIVWDFGDGSPNITGTSTGILYLYNTTNPIINANVTVTSNQGCTNQFTFPAFAYGIPPTNTIAYTIALRDTFCGSENIRFYGYADSANSYTWDFGDGASAATTDTIIFHKYFTLGWKKVILTPYYNGCEGPRRTINIFIEGVIALYDYGNICSNKSKYKFINNSLGNISSYEWTFSDMPGFIDTSNFSPTHTFPNVATSVVKLALYDNATGCTDELITYIYTARPTFLSDKNNVCRDSAITYAVLNSYPTGVGYSYEFHINGIVLDNGDSSIKTINPSNFGTFNDYVVIKDQISGTCDDTLRLAPINVRGPFLTVLFPPRICQDSAVIFINNSYPWFAPDKIVKWKWDFGDGKKDFVKNPLPHFYASSGQHIIKLEATDINGCGQRFESPVHIAYLPTIKILPGIDTLCLGQSGILRGYTSDSLAWITTTNINCITCDTVTVNPTVTTNYIAMSTTYFGCKSYDTALIKVYSPFNLIVTPPQVSVCHATPVQYNLNVTGITTWSPPSFLNSPSIQSPISIPNLNVIYTIRVSDSVGCYSDTVTASIAVFPKPMVDAGPDQVVPYNTAFNLSPVYGAGTQIYLWTPAVNLSCSNCPAPSGIALQKQQYEIYITDANNCKAKDRVTIFVSCAKSNLVLPSAFTPNGDGKNETFYPVARGYQVIKSFTIFSRSGAKVFERKNFQPNVPSDGWDGIVNDSRGENMQTYVWMIEGICDTGMSIFTKGTVILIK